MDVPELDGFRILDANVDTLVVTADFAVRNAIRRDLQRAQALRALALGRFEQGQDLDVDTGEVLELNRFEELRRAGEDGARPSEADVDAVVVLVAGRPVLVEGYSWGGYQWFLRCDDFDLWLNPEKKKTRPTAKVRFRPEYLARLGAADAWAEVRALLGHLTSTGLEARVLDIHIKVDFLGAAWLAEWQTVPERMVTRALRRTWRIMPLAKSLPKPIREQTARGREDVRLYGKGAVDSGWTLGRKGNIEIGCYNKTFEIGCKAGVVPDWQRRVWASSGPISAAALDPRSDPRNHVMRLECRIGSEALRTFRLRRKDGTPLEELRTPEDVIPAIPDLWRYCTEGWLRVVDRTRTRIENCPTTPVWAALQSWPLGHGGPENCPTFSGRPHVEVSRVRAGLMKARQLIPTAFGAGASLLACAGPREMLALARKVKPDADALDATAFVFRQFLGWMANKGALGSVTERLFGEALEKELKVAVELNRPTEQLQSMVLHASEHITDADRNRVILDKIAEVRKERKRRQERIIRKTFKGCDLSDPAIAEKLRKKREEHAAEDREMRALFERAVRELFHLEEGTNVERWLVGDSAA